MTFGNQTNEEDAFAQLDYCLSQFPNGLFIDTAELYPVPPNTSYTGKTEEIIGHWLTARNIDRNKIILASKVHGHSPSLNRSFITGQRSDPPKDEGVEPLLTRDQIMGAFEASLRRLQTTYIDLYQIHWPARYVPAFGLRAYDPKMERKDLPSIEEQVLAIGELIQAGKVKAWGLSNETTFGVCQFSEACKRLGVPLPCSIQNDFSLTHRFFEEELAEACAPSNYNIGLLSYGSLCGGALSGKYIGDGELASIKKTETSRHAAYKGFQPRYMSERVMEAAREYADLARSKGLSPASLALAWAASRWYMGSVIIGFTTIEQLKECIEACSIELEETTLQAIDEIHLRRRNPNATT